MPTAGVAPANNTSLMGLDDGTGTAPPPITISPEELKFGVIPSGFYYNLKFFIKNNTLTPMRVKIECKPGYNEKNNMRLVGLPDLVAPGMITTIVMELTTEHPGMSIFHIKVSQNYNGYTCEREIHANIITPETFKHVKKSLQIQKRPIYEANVQAAGPMMTNMSASLQSASITEALIMDDEDIDDLLDLPSAPNVFWDPVGKCLRLDPLLGQVVVDPELTLEECLQRTEESRQHRLVELEEQRFLTKDAIDQIRKEREKTGYRDPYAGITGFPAFDDADDEEEDADEGNAGNAAEGDDLGQTQASYRSVVSVSSLLALKRDRIDQQRRATISASSNFAKDSRNDKTINSMRTLNLIQSKSKSVRLPDQPL